MGGQRFLSRNSTLAIVCVFVLLAVSASAQPGQTAVVSPLTPTNAVLANGNPPLTESMVDLYTNFEAWLLEIPRTRERQNEVRAMMLEDWKKPAEIKTYLSSLTMASAVSQGTPELREFVRCFQQPRSLQAMRADKRNPDAQRLVAAFDQAHPPIAPGNPPLTDSMVSRFTSYLGWVLQIRLTQPLKDNLRAALLEDWKTPKEMKSDVDFLNWQIAMAPLSNEEEEYFRSRAEPEIIKGMRADRANPAAPWIVAAYDAAHPSIAAGNSPLTRQAADAFIELLCFTRNQSGGPHQDANQAVKDSNAEVMAQNYPQLSSEQQQKLAAMPQNWAQVRMMWVKGSEADRQKMVAQWRPAAQSGRPAEVDAAFARYNALLAEDARNVSEQELLRTAQDCDALAQYCRRAGDEQALTNAATWDQIAHDLRTGKEAWVRLRDEGQAAARYSAFVKRDANAVSEQELAQAARDAFAVAQNLRRRGGEQNLANAATWEQAARNLSAGKQAYLQQIGAQAASATANSQVLAMMRLQYQAQAQMRAAQTMQNIQMMGAVTGMNITGNIGNSPYQYQVRYK